MTAINRPELLVLVRHAKSLREEVKGKDPFYRAGDEAAMRIQHIPDHEMPIADPYGVEQSQLTGIGIVRDYGVFDVAYDSGYRRTIQTRVGSLEAYTPEDRARIQIRSNPMLRERESGYTYFMTAEEVATAFPWLLGQVKDQGYFYFRPPGGKSHADLCDQVYPFIHDELFQIQAGKRVIIFSHAGTIGIMRLHLEEWTIDQWEHMLRTDPTKNCSVTVYRYSSTTRRLELECYNKVYWKEENGIVVPA